MRVNSFFYGEENGENNRKNFRSVNKFIKDKITPIVMQIDLCFTIYMFVANLIELRIKDIISDKPKDIIKHLNHPKT